MAQSVEHPTLDFGSGHDPRVVGSSPKLGSMLSMKPAWNSPSFSAPPPLLLSLSLPLSLSLALSQIKKFKKIFKILNYLS